MLYTLLLDYELRIAFATDIAAADTPTTGLIGRHPWEFCKPKQADEIRMHYETALARRRRYNWATHWDAPEPFAPAFVVNVSDWVGAAEIAIVNVIQHFCVEACELTPRESEVVIELGRGNGVKAVAKTLGLRVSSVHSHMTTIRGKLGLDSIDALTAFAARYRLFRLC